MKVLVYGMKGWIGQQFQIILEENNIIRKLNAVALL